jgi:hypothetical protein
MDRIIVITPEELKRSEGLDVAQRIRQANAALRLYTALHGVPPARPGGEPVRLPARDAGLRGDGSESR